MKRFYQYLMGALCVLLVGAQAAMAEGLTYTIPTLDVTNLGTMITAILAALGAIWGVRKAIKVINRS